MTEELLSTILGIDKPHNINKYELLHLMKEYLDNVHGTCLSVHRRADLSVNSTKNHFFVVKLGIGNDKNAGIAYGDTEYEAVIEACIWSLKENR